MKHRIIVGFALLASVAMACDTQAFWGSRGSAGGSYGGSYGGGSYGGSYGGGSYGGSTGGSTGGSFGGGSYGSGSRGGGLFSGRRSVSVSYASAGSSGSYGSAGSAGSYASSGSNGSRGGGLLSRIGARLRSRRSSGSAGSYAVSYGSSGSTGGSYASSHSTSYGSSGSYGGGSYGSSYSYPVETSYETSYPVEHAHSSDCGCSACTGEVTTGGVANAETGNGLLRVEVPADAVVYVNGKLTTSKGTHRQYASYDLEAGRSYSYEVRVEYQANGKTVTESKTVTLTAGSDELLAFAASRSNEAVATKLQLRVPADAKVTLSGVATKQTGELREYVTTRLADGQKWNNYDIVVEFEANGQTVKQQKTITLEGGKSQELAFVDSAEGLQLASRN